MLNDHNMYEHVLNDELWLGVVGMLECVLLDTYLVYANLSNLF